MDNSPPTEPQDVKAHLHGGIPIKEVEELKPWFNNYEGLREILFSDLRERYLQFVGIIQRKEDIKTVLERSDSVKEKHAQYQKKITEWWQTNLFHLENLPKKRNVFDLYRIFARSIAEGFSGLDILDIYKARGAFAAYWNSIESDLKSVAASGWNAELIPEDEILESQFPEVLQELRDNEARRDEIEAMFKEVNDIEEDEYNEEDYEVFPKEVLKDYKAHIKALGGEIRLFNKEIKALEKRYAATANSLGPVFNNDPRIKNKQKGVTDELDELIEMLQNSQENVKPLEKQKAAIEERLQTHTNLETELRECKKVIKEIKDKKDDLVEKAREKITPEEAKALILDRWKEVLYITILAYVVEYQRDLLSRLENIYEKYTVTINDILEERKKESAQLEGFLKELEYE